MNNVRNIQATIKGDVNMEGYRHIVEGYALVRDLAGFINNFSKDSVLLFVGGHKTAISDFIQDLKIDNTKTIEIETLEIETLEIKEDIKLPYPFARVIGDEMKEIAERLDKVVNVLSVHTGILQSHDTTLKEHTGILQGIDNKLDTMNNSINDNFTTLNDNLNTLPERIAEAMKR